MDRADTERLQARLQAMDDATLLRFVRASEYICSAVATQGDLPEESFVIHCREARNEWKHRHPKSLRKPPASIALLLDK
jgi:hypothetical protein